MKIIGLDLASENGITGAAIFDGKNVLAMSIRTDDEIISLVSEHKPSVIAIDAPLTKPKSGMWRKAELELIRRKIKVFSPLLPTMVPLTKRGMRLKGALKKHKIIEIFPGAVFDHHKVPRKNTLFSVSKLAKKVLNASTQGGTNQHERDAIAAVIAGYHFISKKAEAVGDKKEGTIVIPK